MARLKSTFKQIKEYIASLSERKSRKRRRQKSAFHPRGYNDLMLNNLDDVDEFEAVIENIEV